MAKGYKIYNTINCHLCRKKHSCMHRMHKPLKFQDISDGLNPFKCKTAYEIPGGRHLVYLVCNVASYREVL